MSETLVTAFAMHGISSRREADCLEEELSSQPSPETEARLLGFYLAHMNPDDAVRERATNHLASLVSEAPGAPFVGLRLDFDRRHVEKLELAWEQALLKEPTNPGVLANAARFFAPVDIQRAVALLERAAELEPHKLRWQRELGLLCIAGLAVQPSRRRDLLDRAAGALEVAASLPTTDDEDRVLLDVRAEVYALLGRNDLAERLAVEALKAGERVSDWYSGNLLHVGRLVLAVLAVRRRDFGTAASLLIDAANVPRSPQFRVRGPAIELLTELACDELRGEMEAFVASWRAQFGLPRLACERLASLGVSER